MELFLEHLHAPQTAVMNMNLFRIYTGVQFPIELKPTCSLIHHQVNSRINILCAHLRIATHIGAPSLARSYEIVQGCLVGHFPCPLHFSRPIERHAKVVVMQGVRIVMVTANVIAIKICRIHHGQYQRIWR